MKITFTTIFVATIVAVATFLITAASIPHVAIAPTSHVPASATVIPMNIVSLRETASTSPTVLVEYPQFPGLPADLNDAIASATMSRLAQFRSDVAENEAGRHDTNGKDSPPSTIPPSSYDFIANWQTSQVNSKYVSLLMRYGYYTGGANASEELQTFNYDVIAKKIVTLGDLFGAKPDYLNTISQMARSQLSESLSNASPGYDPTSQLNPGTEPTEDNFADFVFTDNLVTFYFPKYAVAAGAFGEQHVTIPVSSLR